MKVEKRLRVLEFLKNAGYAIEDAIFIFSLPYGTSLSRMYYLIEKRQVERDYDKINDRTKRRFQDFLYHLKKDGLVVQDRKDGKIFLKITQKGKAILKRLRQQSAEDLPLSKYDIEEEKALKIIIFDIPERQRRKRRWLREALRNIKFTMLQKSVWAGKTKLPQRFLEDLDAMDISRYVEIFAISKTGSLRQLRLGAE